MDEDEKELAALLRENKYLLRIIGGLGSGVLLLCGLYFQTVLSSLETRMVLHEDQIQRQWTLALQRGDRVTALENRLNSNDSITSDLLKQQHEVMRDLARAKVLLKMDH